jgi:hypothetical protein
MFGPESSFILSKSLATTKGSVKVVAYPRDSFKQLKWDVYALRMHLSCK